MKKEFYKLVIVFIMIVFSFSLAFFLGKEIILSGPYEEKTSPNINSQNKGTLKLSKDHLISREEDRGGQRKKIEEYRKKLITENPATEPEETNPALATEPEETGAELAKPVARPTTAESTSTTPEESPTSELTTPAGAKTSTKSENKKEQKKTPIEIKKPQTSAEEEAPVTKQLYGLLIEKYNEKEPAMEKSTKFKLRFPNLRVFFKQSKDMYKVYIGPFSSKEKAEDFLKKWEKKEDAPPLLLEKI